MSPRLLPALVGVLLLACPTAPAPRPDPAPRDLTTVCCAQCRTAASKDPQAMDLTLLPCANYAGHIVNGEQVLEQRCAEWFGAQALTVGDCAASR